MTAQSKEHLHPFENIRRYFGVGEGFSLALSLHSEAGRISVLGGDLCVCDRIEAGAQWRC
jgi:hypothetical protein